MAGQYSEGSTAEDERRPVLVLDSASPVVSVALALAGELLAARSVELAQSSRRLLALIDEVMREGEAELRDLGGAIALRGPGSFTGLRVGLATLLGIHQAAGVPATAISTLFALALQADNDAGQTVAAVDALRGEFFIQAFSTPADKSPRPLGEPRCEQPQALEDHAPCQVIGFALQDRLRAAKLSPSVEIREPEPLAARAAEHFSLNSPSWESSLLISPLYLRPPAASPRPATEPRPGSGSSR